MSDQDNEQQERLFREESERVKLFDPLEREQEQTQHQEPSQLESVLAQHIPPGMSAKEATSLLSELDGRQRSDAIKWLNSHLGAAFASQVEGLLADQREGNISERDRGEHDLGLALAHNADRQLGLSPEPLKEPVRSISAEHEALLRQDSNQHEQQQTTPELQQHVWRADPVLGPVGFSWEMDHTFEGTADPDRLIFTSRDGLVFRTSQTSWSLDQITIDRSTGAIELLSREALSVWEEALLTDLLRRALHEPSPSMELGEELHEVLHELRLVWEKPRQKHRHDDERLDKENETTKDEERNAPSSSGGVSSQTKPTAEHGTRLTLWSPVEGIALTMLAEDRIKLMWASDGMLLTSRLGLSIEWSDAPWLGALSILQVVYDSSTDRIGLRLGETVEPAITDACSALFKHHLLPRLPGQGEDKDEPVLLYVEPTSERLEHVAEGRCTALIDVERTVLTAKPPLQWVHEEACTAISRLHHLRSAQSIVVHTETDAHALPLRGIARFMERLPGWALSPSDPEATHIVLAES
ncbi:MAG: hypothetical protein AAFS10_08865 [Myxococcota bacterium]